ncbi:hypothetical protein Tco_1210230 [Tanacetum coccineum]
MKRLNIFSSNRNAVNKLFVCTPLGVPILSGTKRTLCDHNAGLAKVTEHLMARSGTDLCANISTVDNSAI